MLITLKPVEFTQPPAQLLVSPWFSFEIPEIGRGKIPFLAFKMFPVLEDSARSLFISPMSDKTLQPIFWFCNNTVIGSAHVKGAPLTTTPTMTWVRGIVSR